MVADPRTITRYLRSSRAEGLKLALQDFRRRRLMIAEQEAFVVAADRELIDTIPGILARFRFVPASLAEHADACILSAPVVLDRPEPIVALFDQLPSGGAVLATFKLASFRSHHRETLARELAIALPFAVCRIVDMGIEARDLGLTPWIVIERRRPRCWLFLGQSGAGKTSAVIDLGLRSGMQVFHADLVLERIARRELPADPALVAAAADAYVTADWSAAIMTMLDRGLFPDVADAILAEAAGADFCFEFWAPPEYHASIVAFFRGRGYHPFAPGIEFPEPSVT